MQVEEALAPAIAAPVQGNAVVKAEPDAESTS